MRAGRDTGDGSWIGFAISKHSSALNPETAKCGAQEADEWATWQVENGHAAEPTTQRAPVVARESLNAARA